MNKFDYDGNPVLYPLTHPQKRIWYIEKIYPGTSLYNIGGPIRIKGSVDFAMLEESIHHLIQRNEGLRIRFIEKNGDIYQYVSQYEKIKIDFKDFSIYEEPEAEFQKWVKKEAGKPFVLDNEGLFYFALFKISEKDNGYLAKFHHIIADGWSINIMTEQVCSTYMKLLNGEQINDQLEPSYIEYIDQEQKYLSSDRFLKNKSFWNEKFKVLPESFLKKSSDLTEGKRKTFELDAELSLKIKEYAQQHKCSLNTFFVVLYLLYLNKTTQQEDIVLGTPVLNRSGKKEKSMFGMFTSTMPFRFMVGNDATVLELLAKVNEELMACYFNQKYPYNLLVQDLELKKKGYDNLFDICVNYYNTKLNSELNGSPIENVEFYNGNQAYSMQLVIKDWSDSESLTLDFDYKIHDYTDEQIEDMVARFNYLIEQMLANPEEKVGKLTLLSKAEENKLLLDFNASGAEYPKDKTIIQLFEEQVVKTPDKIAINYKSCELTYRDLNKKANCLARYLVEKGIGRETIVGLLTIHSIETVVGILGVLKAGGAYLPIDPGYPQDRISYMLEDSGAAVLLTNVELPQAIGFSGDIINLNSFDFCIKDIENLEPANKPQDLVYVIYTSGSTGKPKGTMIEHQGLVNYIWWAKKMYVKGEDEVFPLYSSLSFDLTVTSIFTPLISGSRIMVYRDDEAEYVLYRIMKENRATVIKLTPAHLSLLKDADNRNSSVRRFIVGGEDLKVSLSKDIHESFGGQIEIFNEYGPTETVVGCMIHRFDHENDLKTSVPIGIPADNVQIYILDKNLHPVPPETIGEMYISGDGVARGYLNRPELTQEKFIENPFIKGSRMYRTGDLARFLGNGKIEYAGRVDHQVKIRGYRIELGEIERLLLEHEAISGAVVIDCEDENKSKYLCAYTVNKYQVSSSQLRDYLMKDLPDYMIPSYFMEIDEIPLTANGKVNRALLPKPESEASEDKEFVAGRNEKEEKLASVICAVLNIERVSVKQNFYHLGGDSIKAIQIAAKMSDDGFKIKVKDILANPIIEEMALHIEQNEGCVISQEPCEGVIKPSPIVSWFFAQNFANPDHYNQSVLLELKQGMKVEKLEMIFNELIKHHDSLRINYNAETGELFYNPSHLAVSSHIEEYDLSDLSESDQYARLSQAAEIFNKSFDIESGTLIKACAFNLGGSRRLLITAHHLVIDGVSWRILLEDINTLANQLEHGQPVALPPKTHSYQKWVEALADYSRTEIAEEKKYWDAVLNRDFSFTADHDLGPDRVDTSHTASIQISESETEALMARANTTYNTTPRDLLITSLLRTIKEHTGSEEIVLELEGHGREDILNGIDITRTVGWFTSLYPFGMTLKGSELSHQIKEVKEELRKIPNNGIGFGILKYLSKSLKEDNRKYIRFNYLGDFSTELDSSTIKLLSDQLGHDHGKGNSLTAIMDINCFMVSGKLSILLTYSKNKFSEDTIRKFMDGYADSLKSVIDHCCGKEEVEFTPSDFDTVDLSLEELDSFFN